MRLYFVSIFKILSRQKVPFIGFDRKSIGRYQFFVTYKIQYFPSTYFISLTLVIFKLDIIHLKIHSYNFYNYKLQKEWINFKSYVNFRF